MNIDELYNELTSHMTAEQALKNLLKGHIITYESLKFQEGEEIHPVILISMAVYDLNWDLAIPDGVNDDEDVKGMIVGTEAYVDSILTDIDYAKLMRGDNYKSDYWNGYITDFTEEQINCILQRDFNEDKELTLGRELLSDKQNDLVSNGLLIRYDILNHIIEFRTPDSRWV